MVLSVATVEKLDTQKANATSKKEPMLQLTSSPIKEGHPQANINN
jgi:hypothetical protein